MTKRDELALVDRQDALNHLRQNDVAEGLWLGEPHRRSRLGLARVDALDPGAEHLGHVGREVHAEGDDGDQHRVDVDRREHHVEDQHQQHDDRNAAQNRDVDPRRRAEQRRRRHAHEADQRAQRGAEEGGRDGDDRRGAEAVQEQQIAALLDDVVVPTGRHLGQERSRRRLGRSRRAPGQVRLQDVGDARRFVVGSGEVDPQLALLGDEDGGDDHLHLAAGGRGDQTAEWHFRPGGFAAEVCGESLDQLDVQADPLAVDDRRERQRADTGAHR